MQVVALYCRASKDRSGRVESVTAQEKWGRRYADAHWPAVPVRVYRDNALTAADEDTRRPDYEQLREDIRGGEIAHVWAVEQTRLERTEVGWFRLAAELYAGGITELHTRRDGIVRVQDDVAGIKAVLAAGEIRRLRQRLVDKHSDLAASGRPSGGAQVGYRPGRDEAGRATLVIEPVEADAIRWACASVLSGWSLARIGAEWDRLGIAHPRGGKTPWAKSTAVLRRLLSKASIAGLRSIGGETVRPATWDPIVPEATWRAVKATLESRSHSTGTDGQAHRVTHLKRPARRYLLTGGIAVCGRAGCGAPLVGQQRRWRNSPLVAYYSCHPSRGGCSRLGIAGEQFEAEVTRRLLEHLDELDEFKEAIAVDEHEDRRDEILAEMRALDGRRAELARRWALNRLSPVEWDAARAAFDEEANRLSAELAALPAPAVAIDPQAIKAGWAEMTLDERRHALMLFVGLGGVKVMPARPGARFDPERIIIPRWRL